MQEIIGVLKQVWNNEIDNEQAAELMADIEPLKLSEFIVDAWNRGQLEFLFYDVTGTHRN